MRNAMAWLSLEFVLPAVAAEAFGDALMSQGALSVSLDVEVARGKLLHRTPTLAFCEGSVVDEKQQLCAHATGTFKYLRALRKPGAKEVSRPAMPHSKPNEETA